MAGTQVNSGDALAVKLYSAAVFAGMQRKNTFTNRMTGPAPTQSSAEAKIRQQTSPDYPVVRVTDLSDNAGDRVSVDLFHTIGGKPIVGDRQAEGRGERLSNSTQEIRIDLLTKVVDAGGKMTQKRTKHNLRSIARAQLVNYFAKLNDQQTLIAMAGARGSDVGSDWLVPLDADPDYADIMVNAVQAPTFRGHCP
jgi:N4-gp56 family major capsid protein